MNPTSTGTDEVLRVKGLTKYFPVHKGMLRKLAGTVKAVDQISFSIKRGETFALIGESGCGKTTTIKTILLLEQATSGEVLFRGQNVLKGDRSTIKSYRHSVQAVFQDPFSSLEPRQRVASIISEPLRSTSRMSKRAIASRVKEVLDQVGLRPDAIDQYPHEFSGGQRQRIAVARALAPLPDLVILDEPVSALDVSIRAQIMNLLKDLQEQLGVAYLLVAHDLATVRHMCDRVGIMYLGKLVEVSAGEALFERPLHPYTGALLSAALPSHPRVSRSEIQLSGEIPSPLNPPAGCRFHPRCPQAIMPACSESEPELVKFEEKHYVACHMVRNR